MSTTSNLKLNKHDNVSTNTNPFDIENCLNVNWDKIDEYAGNSNSTILKLQEENTRLKETIQTELEEKTIEAESIEVNDSAEANCEIDLIGNTTQETTTGINKFNTARIETGTKHGVTCTYNSNDDSITFNGTCTNDNTIFQLPSENIIKGNPGKTRIIAYWLNGSATGTALVMLFDSSFNKGLRADLTVLNSNKQTTSASYGSSETQADFIYNRIRFNNGSVLNNFTIKVMVVEDGQTTETPYEKFTGGEASPNPDYPSKVETVTGSVEVKVRNKNLYDSSFRNSSSQVTCFGGTATEKNGIFSVTKTRDNLNTTVNDIINKGQLYNANTAGPLLEIKDNNYTIKCSNVLFNRIFITQYDKNKISLGYNGTPSNVVQFTPSQEAKYFSVRFGNNSEPVGTTLNTTIQIEKGSQATDFVQHKEQTYSLYLPFELCKIGEYKDYIFKENNKWYKHKVIGKRILKGNEGWGKSSTYSTANYVMFYLNSSSYTQDYDGYCDKFVWGKTNEIRNAEKELIGHAGASINIKIKATRANTVDDFNSWLSNNNTTVYYILETPVDEEITDTTLIQQLNKLEEAMSYYGTTYVDTTNEVIKPIIKFTYNRSNRLRIENLEKAIINS